MVPNVFLGPNILMVIDPSSNFDSNFLEDTSSGLNTDNAVMISFFLLNSMHAGCFGLIFH